MPYICDVCGRDRWSEEKPCPWCEPLSECGVEEKPRAAARVQDYPDLDAAGLLLVALGHLVKAKEKLDQEPPSRTVYRARRDTVYASNFVRNALKELDELKVA